MNNKYNLASLKMPILLNELLRQSSVSRNDLGIIKIPKSGVYAFFENDKAIYIGRSNRMKERLKKHSSISADQYSASLAFRIAKKDYLDKSLVKKKPKNSELMANSDFLNRFNAAKMRISISKIRFIEVKD
jgi:hypothetical protein